MLSQDLHPSFGLPDFLKAELGVGDAKPYALASAIDESASLLALGAFLRVFDLQSSTACAARRDEELRAMGFTVNALVERDREALYAVRREILSARGTVGAIECLAAVYFPGSRVNVGFPYEKTRLGRTAQVRLADLRDRRKIVFIRTAAQFPAERCQEFLGNVDALLPLPFEAVLAFPTVEKEAAIRWCLGSQRSWEKRRVACLISRK